MRATTFRRSAATCALLGIVAVALSVPAHAQRADESYFRVTPYIWALSLDGNTGLPTGGDLPIDASFSDLLDNLNMALMVDLEWNTQSGWFFLFDAMWADLESDFSSDGPLGASGKTEIEMFLYDGLVGYSINENIGAYIGARLYDQDVTISTDGPLPNISIGDDWTDYIIGARVFGELNENWSLGGRIDAAFAGDSDSAVNLQFIFARHFGETMHLNLGWRYYDVDFESGSGVDRYKWDVSHSGPLVGWSWEF